MIGQGYRDQIKVGFLLTEKLQISDTVTFVTLKGRCQLNPDRNLIK